MAGCGSLRRDGARVGEEVEGEAFLAVEPLGGGEMVAVSEACVASFFLSPFRGGSLIRPASLRWWSSKRLKIRSACRHMSQLARQAGRKCTPYLGVVGVLGGFVEGRGGQLVLMPRRRDAVPVCGGCGVANVLVGFGEVCRLHLAFVQLSDAAGQSRGRGGGAVWFLWAMNTTNELQ
jgi:hypothetical protein